MKIKLFYMILSTILIGGCFAQQSYLEPSVYYAKKDYYFGLRTSINELINKIGEPEKRKLLSEGKYDEDLYWPGLYVSTSKEQVAYIYISSKDFSVNGIKVGDTLSDARRIFKDVGENDTNYKILTFINYIDDLPICIGFKYDESDNIQNISINIGI